VPGGRESHNHPAVRILAKGASPRRCLRAAKTKRVTQIGGLYRCSQFTLSGCQLAPDVASVVRSECGPFEAARFVNPCHQPMWTGLFRWLSGHSAHPCRALNARSFRQNSPRVADRGASIPDCGPGSIVPAPAIRPASGGARSASGGPAPAAAVQAPPLPPGSTRHSIRPRSRGCLRGGWPPAGCGSRGSTGPVV